MSATGPISNYVDLLISHDNEDSLASRFPPQGLTPPPPDPAVWCRISDFPSCSFAPKPAAVQHVVAPVPSQSSCGLPPVRPPAPPRRRHALHADSGSSRCPAPSPSPASAGGRHAPSPDASTSGAAPTAARDGRSYPDYMYGCPGSCATCAPQTLPSPEADALAGSKHKEEKADLDPQ